jgi:hypothetical protein
VLDDRDTNAAPLRGVCDRRGAPRPSTCGIHSELIDDADERTRTDRGTDREDPDADDPAIRLGDDHGGRRHEEEVAEPIGVLALLIRIGRVPHQDADGGVDIGQAGAADVILHGGLSGAKRSASAADVPAQG